MTRGIGLPGLGLSVTVPPVTYPNPNAAREGRTWQFLSYPAAIPTGFRNLMPARSISRRALLTVRKGASLRQINSGLNAISAALWAVSGESLNRIGLMNALYVSGFRASNSDSLS